MTPAVCVWADETSHKIGLMHISDKLLTWPIGTRLVCVGGFTKGETPGRPSGPIIPIIISLLCLSDWTRYCGRKFELSDKWGWKNDWQHWPLRVGRGKTGNNIFDVLWRGTNGTFRSDCAWVGNIVRCNRICSIDMSRERESSYSLIGYLWSWIMGLQGSRIEWMNSRTNRHVSNEEMKTIEMIPSTDHIHCIAWNRVYLCWTVAHVALG